MIDEVIIRGGLPSDGEAALLCPRGHGRSPRYGDQEIIELARTADETTEAFIARSRQMAAEVGAETIVWSGLETDRSREISELSDNQLRRLAGEVP